MNESLVSIITPLYNSEKFISETIESVLSQKYNNWEMIIVDDCSTDGGVEIVKDYKRNDERIKLIQLDKNSGAAIARNKAIEYAKGRFIAFLDSDDLWHPNKLKKQIDFMIINDYEFTYTGYQKITEKGQILDKYVSVKKKLSYKKALYSNYIGCLTVVYDRKKLGKIYMPLIKKRQDYALWLKILKIIKFGYGLDENLAYYRLRDNSMSSNKINLIKYHWKLYRDIEELSVLKSLYYLINNIFIKIFSDIN